MNNDRELVECLKRVKDLLTRATAGLDIESNAYLIEEALAVINGALGVPSEMAHGWVKLPFGKHKGKTIKEVLEEDPQYIKWLVYKSGIVPRGLLKEALNEYIRINGGEEFKDDELPWGYDSRDFPLFDAMDGCLPNQ